MTDQIMPPNAYELFARVQQAAANTPYKVVPTEKGFDVELDVADATWFGLFNKAGLKHAFIHHVSIPETGTYSVTDDARTVEWIAGTPRISYEASREIGRIKKVSFNRTYAFNEEGEFSKVVDFKFNSEEGRALIDSAATDLGYRQVRGSIEKVGLFIGLGTLVLLVLMGVVIGAVILLR
ncbi:hypothetical protein [Nocardioides panzhihuensis]|uniref:Uncharacterized protein n=1 Tax=Nocardioides panzhihuensis TaxID=860243 RepID=A0A7Z0DRJ1_9ACTN|nr:hypothetical protein [Nocardioides panzhihuensis]NYI80357.1 hypothetical protein [Nocardioides panzhihuensis]